MMEDSSAKLRRSVGNFNSVAYQVFRLAKDRYEPVPGEEPSLKGSLELIKSRPEPGESRICHFAANSLGAYGFFRLGLGFLICGMW